jgi:multiple sugar transport system substrate-binding protein
LAKRDRPLVRGLVWFALGVAAVLLVSSLRSIVIPSSGLEPGELVVLSGADDSVGGQRQRLIDEWNRAHPDNPARIESLSNQADRQHSEMVARAQSGQSGVDVYNLDVTWIAEFAAAHFIQPLDDSVDTEGFLDKPLATCRFDGRLWALPFNTDAGLLFYRTDLTSRAALPKRIPPSEADMRALTASGQAFKAGYVGQLARYEGQTVNVLEAIWAAGGEVIRDDRVVIDEPEAQAALRQLANGMVGTGDLPPAVLPDSTSSYEKESTESFRSGEVALMRNWPVAYGQLTSTPESGSGFNIARNFDVAPLPGPSVLGGQNLAISSDTKNPRAAQALIEFLTSERSERILFAEGGLAATRESTYSDPAVRAARPYADTLLRAIRDARPRPLTTHYGLFTSVFQEVISQALEPARAEGERGRLPDGAVSRLTNALHGRLR